MTPRGAHWTHHFLPHDCACAPQGERRADPWLGPWEASALAPLLYWELSPAPLGGHVGTGSGEAAVTTDGNVLVQSVKDGNPVLAGEVRAGTHPPSLAAAVTKDWNSPVGRVFNYF